ncbi:uncharacterized protein LOC132947713 [Metopolophium dirhodum]|uniref:uncharacterized protein LOC132947713 n=1 Tax=Metopolophium dirhodum TaxID=44670 RepID=UPI00298FDAAE|nr:uncharacterized protein LOC132947713 [Metopolophium dirhodum]
MTTVFHITLRPILILSKCIGLIDISYIVEPTGLLDRNNVNSMIHGLLEIARMIVLITCTFIYFYQFDQELHILQIIYVVKFWFIIVAARISTIWIIKFINGIIEFDRKTTPLSTNLMNPNRSWTKRRWETIFILICAYFIGFIFLKNYFWPVQIKNIVLLATHAIFTVPYVMDYVVTISSCFFLQNLYVRFQTLNDFWKCLPADLDAIPGQWTDIEIVDLMENTRLLHSELCDLLKMFSLGYGPLLLGFFTSSYIGLLFSVYYIVNKETFFTSSTNAWEHILPLIIHLQILMFLMSIIVFVSFINEKRLQIISYLRLYRISNLHLDKKRQIKMFMNQISVCDSDQISAFGFFNINLNLVTTILVLLFSGIITLIQMKDHPMMLKFNNDTKSFFLKIYTTKYD